jgi:hypothetical protein
MKRRPLSAALPVAALVLFWIANRGAYKDFFQADSLDNLAMMQSLGYGELFLPLLVPRVGVNNFRPVGMLFFKLMGRQFGLWFPPYAVALQLLHILNTGLLIWLLLRLGLTFLAACAGGLFFLFHMALFHVLWEPMFAFDLICCSLCLLSFLAYIDGRWIVSFLLFWLAYRTKENAIGLPAVFFAYEWLLGDGKWKRLIPFFALSMVLSIQALINNAVRESDYTLRFDPASIWKCIAFYAKQLLLVPYAGLAILAVPLFTRNRRMWFGFAWFCILIAPMLLLPGRLFSAYLYVPLIGLAMFLATLAEWQPKLVIAVLLALWIPWNFVNLRWLRKAELARADTARQYVANVAKAAQKYPGIRTFLYHDIPMESYTIPAVVRLIQPASEDVKVLAVDDPGAPKAVQSQPVVLLDWQPTPVPGSVVTLAHTRDAPDASFIVMDRGTPLWQLGRGWNLADRGPYRWIEPSATARLTRPADASQFELTVNIFPEFFKYVPKGHVRVSLDGHPIGERDFDRPGVEVVRWNLAKAPAGVVRVDFETQPGFRTEAGGNLFGLSFGNFGFVTP